MTMLSQLNIGSQDMPSRPPRDKTKPKNPPLKPNKKIGKKKPK